MLTTQIAAHFGWRAAFFVAGAPGLVLAALVAMFIDETPSRSAQDRTHTPVHADLSALLRNRNLWASAIGTAGVMSWLFLVNAFGPLYITKIEHQAATTAGFLMGAAGLGSFFIGLIGPTLSDRFGRRPILALQALLSVLLPLALLTQGLYGASWLLAGILFLTQGCDPQILNAPIDAAIGNSIGQHCGIIEPCPRPAKSRSSSSAGPRTRGDSRFVRDHIVVCVLSLPTVAGK